MSSELTTWHDVSDDEGPELWPNYVPAPYSWQELEILEDQWRKEAEERQIQDEERMKKSIEWERQKENSWLSAIERANDGMWDEIDREIEESRQQEQAARMARPNPLALWFWASFFFDLGDIDLFPDE